MIRASKILLVLAVGLLAVAAQAQTVKWTYVEGGISWFDPDRGDDENGWFVGGAVGLGKIPIHIIADYADYDRIEIFQVGGGWHGLLGESADLFADGAFYDAEYDDGFKVRFGVRWMVLERLELNGNLYWTELDFSDNKGAAINGIFSFVEHFGVGGGIQWGDDFSTARAFVRFSF